MPQMGQNWGIAAVTSVAIVPWMDIVADYDAHVSDLCKRLTLLRLFPVELNVEVEFVSLGKLTPHPENPRRGDVEKIAESLRVNAMYKPLVVQRSTGHIIAGNHTWLAARKLGWQEIHVIYHDVDDATARRWMLVDNKTSDAGAYDQDALADILASLNDDFAGTGYSPDDLDDLLAALDAMPVLTPQPTNADYGESPEQIQARLDRFSDAQPRQSFGIREAILVLPQAEFEELHALIRVIKDAAGGDLTAGEGVLRGMKTAARVIARCNGTDNCSWCS